MPLRNPHNEAVGYEDLAPRDTWYHGSPYGYQHMDTSLGSDMAEDSEEWGHDHWNTLLGSHFAADEGTAAGFVHGSSSGNYEEAPGYVYHAKLHISNPKHYDSEYDMDREAYGREFDAGNHPYKHDPDFEGEWEGDPSLSHHEDLRKQPETLKVPDEFDVTREKSVDNRPRFMRWLSTHPDAPGIAARFKKHLESQGHDGVTYGNEIERSESGAQGGLSAIAFHPHQVQLTQRHHYDPSESGRYDDLDNPYNCKHGEEAEREERLWPAHDQPALPGFEHLSSFVTGFIDKVGAMTEGAKGPHYQQKLFHMQPDPGLHEPASGRHNPEDPGAHARWRRENDENYQPRECQHCGADLNDPGTHAEEHDAWLHEQNWHTEWDEDELPGTIHRGVRVRLPREVHEAVHDESLPVHERARVLTRHLLSPQAGSGGLGHFWSGEQDVSKGYAEDSDPSKTPVMLHARFPGMEHVEQDPEQLEHWGVYSYHLSDNREVPLQHEAPVHLTGISWGKPGHTDRWGPPEHKHLDQDPDWSHHEFSSPVEADSSRATSPEVLNRLDRSAALEAHPMNDDDGSLSWDEIADRHPRLYGDPEIHGKEASDDGNNIADAAAHLYHDRPGHPYEETYGELNPAMGGGDMKFYPRSVDPSRIDYMRSGPGDPRVREAERGYRSQQPEKVPPLVLVHRNGVFMPADGHHRSEGAARARKPVAAYVAYSPHDSEPFSEGERGPFHGASTEDEPALADHHGRPFRISYQGFPHTADVPTPQQRTAAVELTAHFEDDEDDEDEGWEDEDDYQPESYSRVSPERDEDDFVWQRRRNDETGEIDRDPGEAPKCLNCSGHAGAEVHHYPEEGHHPEVEERLARDQEHEDRWDRGEHDRTRYCDLNCEISHAEDQAHGVGSHHTFAEGEPESGEIRPVPSDMPQLNGPFEEPAGRSPGRYEYRNPSAEHRCHYCRNVLPQYRREAALNPETELAHEGRWDSSQFARHMVKFHGWPEEDRDGLAGTAASELRDAHAEHHANSLDIGAGRGPNIESLTHGGKFPAHEPEHGWETVEGMDPIREYLGVPPRQAAKELTAHFEDTAAHDPDFPFEDPEHEHGGHREFEEAYEAVDRDSLWPKEHREFPALSTGMRPDFEDLPRGGEDFRWSEGSPHEHYFRHGGPEGWRRDDLHAHLREDHPSAGLDDAIGRADARNGRGTTDEYQALDSIHRRAHGRELGELHSEDPGGTRYQELEQGHRWLENQSDADDRQRQQEDDEDRSRQHSTLHGETMNLHEVENHLRTVHGIPEEAMPAFHHTADDGPYTTPYQSELEELHDQDHGEMGSYRHDEPDEELPRIHGEEMGHEDAYRHLSEHHGFDHDQLRSEEPDARRLEEYHEGEHDRSAGKPWDDHHRDDPWDWNQGRPRRVHPLEKDPDDEDDEDDDAHLASLRATAASGQLSARSSYEDEDEDEDTSGDGYVTCDQGHEHWGTGGAAGAAIYHDGDDGQRRWLLQRRSPFVQEGSTWSTPGGALHHGESPARGALREAGEEFGGLPGDLEHKGSIANDHGGWAYSTEIFRSPHRFDPPNSAGDQWEHGGHGWFTGEEMDRLPLHSGFAETKSRLVRPGSKKASLPKSASGMLGHTWYGPPTSLPFRDDEDREIPPYSGQKLFHGTRSVLRPGDILSHEEASRHSNTPDTGTWAGNNPHVFATSKGREAEYWARACSSYQAQARAEEDGREQPDRGTSDETYHPRVYEVEPTGHVEPDPEQEGMAYRSHSPMRVVREVRPLECQDCPDTGRHEEHWPDHPHYSYLESLQDDDEEDEDDGRWGSGDDDEDDYGEDEDEGHHHGAAEPAETPESRKDYLRGWAASQRAVNSSGYGPSALERADERREKSAWYDGYHDYSVSRPKWHSLRCLAAEHDQPGCTLVDPPGEGRTAVLRPGPDQPSPETERSDRWHEYRNRYMPGTLHRGIHVELPPDLHDYVHDESLPREDRAKALSDHFSASGLGMHWTPHVDIANRAVSNSADGDESSYGAYRGGYYDDDDEDEYGEEGGSRKTDIIFHGQTGARNRLRNPAELERHQIGWSHSQDEDEFPVKPGSPVRLEGISWRSHDPQGTAAYEHADFPKAIRHTSSARHGRKAVVYAHVEDTAHPALDAAPAAGPLPDIASLLGSWEPRTPSDAARVLSDMPGLLRALEEGLGALAGRLDEAPVGEEIPSWIRDMAGSCSAAAEDAEAMIGQGLASEDMWNGSSPGPKA